MKGLDLTMKKNQFIKCLVLLRRGTFLKHIFALFAVFSLNLLFVPVAILAQEPVMSWDFETIRERVAVEESTGITDTIEGNYEEAEGIKGKGLRLDGFTTRVVRKGKDIRKPDSEFTIEAWVSLGGYPLNWCPVITTESDEIKGYRLMIGPYGQVSFETAIDEQWIACSSASKTMPLRKWMHITGVYKAQEKMALYVNGGLVSAVEINGSLTYPKKKSCIIGMRFLRQNTIRHGRRT